MYQPAQHFKEDRLEIQHGLIRDRPLGLLVSHGNGGLIADPVPFLLDEAHGPFGVLKAHLSRANPHIERLKGCDEVMVVFQGENAYVSPGWYATKAETGKVVPTWNYMIVEAWGRPLVRDDEAWLAGQIRALTDRHEAGHALPWRVDDAPDTFIAAQVRGIVGMEIEITRIEGKWKMSQNRNAADRAGVKAGYRDAGLDAFGALIPD